mgnify:FL=1
MARRANDKAGGGRRLSQRPRVEVSLCSPGPTGDDATAAEAEVINNCALCEGPLGDNHKSTICVNCKGDLPHPPECWPPLSKECTEGPQPKGLVRVVGTKYDDHEEEGARVMRDVRGF